MIIEGRNLKHYLDFETLYREEGQHSSVTGIKITRVRLDDLTEHLHDLMDPSNNLHNEIVKQTFECLNPQQKQKIGRSILIHQYCIHRILVLNRVYESDVWTYEVSHDYYGEEVESVVLKPDIAKTVEQQMSSLHHKSDAKRIEYILDLEYGHVIDSVKNREWDLIRTDLGKMHFSNEKYLEECWKSDKEYLKTYRLPRCLAVYQKATGKYKVIDGYHRVCAAGDQSFLIIYCQTDAK